MTFFNHRKLQQNKYTATMASRRSTKVGGGAHNCRPWRRGAARRSRHTALLRASCLKNIWENAVIQLDSKTTDDASWDHSTN